MTPPKPDTMAARDDRAAFLSLAAEHYENFPVGSILVPKRLRPHMHRIYAFARIADDIADERRDAALLEAFRLGSEQMGSEVRAVSPIHRRGGPMQSPIFSTPTSPMHRRHPRCVADALPMHGRCTGDAARSFDSTHTDPI